MRVEDPIERVSLSAHVPDQRICRMRAGRTGFRVEVQDRIDDRAVFRPATTYWMLEVRLSKKPVTIGHA
jgi:hypothetical protein